MIYERRFLSDPSDEGILIDLDLESTDRQIEALTSCPNCGFDARGFCSAECQYEFETLVLEVA